MSRTKGSTNRPKPQGSTDLVTPNPVDLMAKFVPGIWYSYLGPEIFVDQENRLLKWSFLPFQVVKIGNRDDMVVKFADMDYEIVSNPQAMAKMAVCSEQVHF